MLPSARRRRRIEDGEDSSSRIEFLRRLPVRGQGGLVRGSTATTTNTEIHNNNNDEKDETKADAPDEADVPDEVDVPETATEDGDDVRPEDQSIPQPPPSPVDDDEDEDEEEVDTTTSQQASRPPSRPVDVEYVVTDGDASSPYMTARNEVTLLEVGDLLRSFNAPDATRETRRVLARRMSTVLRRR